LALLQLLSAPQLHCPLLSQVLPLVAQSTPPQLAPHSRPMPSHSSHVAAPPGGVGQAVHDVPQWSGSTSLKHWLPQRWLPVEQAQVPAVQTSPLEAAPHAIPSTELPDATHD
jgi:hypothetical protein